MGAPDRNMLHLKRKVSTEDISKLIQHRKSCSTITVCQGKTKRLSFAVGGIPYTRLFLEDIPDENEY